MLGYHHVPPVEVTVEVTRGNHRARPVPEGSDHRFQLSVA
jgi:hypothetical protein